jgi:hypothetical protein
MLPATAAIRPAPGPAGSPAEPSLQVYSPPIPENRSHYYWRLGASALVHHSKQKLLGRDDASNETLCFHRPAKEKAASWRLLEELTS